MDNLDAGIRLAKRVAALQSCSRRQAEALIEAGVVRVDGQVVLLPHSRVTAQRIDIDATAGLLELLQLREVTLLLNKPEDVAESFELLRSETHFKADVSPLRWTQHHLHKQTCPVPLELAASGLLVFSQDARVLRKLTQDAAILEQEFMVNVQGEVSGSALRQLNPNPNLKVSLSSQGAGVSGLRFAFKGWQLGQIAQRCEGAGLRILSIRRLRMGRVSLGPLPSGQWRYLLEHERF
jgi:23S rRNA pseudouridine2604 synthase